MIRWPTIIAVASTILLVGVIVAWIGGRHNHDNNWLPPVSGISVREIELVSSLKSTEWGVAHVGAVELRLPMVKDNIQVGLYDVVGESGRSVHFLGSSESPSGEESFVKEGFMRIHDGSRPDHFNDFEFLLDLYRLDTGNPRFHGEYLRFLRKLAIGLRKRQIDSVSYAKIDNSQLRIILLHEHSDPAVKIYATIYTSDGRFLAEVMFSDESGDESWILNACATIRLS